jgi:hypothetical protein
MATASTLTDSGQARQGFSEGVRITMNRKERAELRAIAAWLKTIRIELPSEPLDLALHASFYKWAIEILEGKKAGQPKKHENPRVSLIQFMKQFKQAQDALIAEGDSKPTQERIYKRMRGDRVTEADAVRKHRERLERQVMSDRRFVEEIKNFMAHEQAKQPWRWDDFVGKEQKRAKQSFDEALARVEGEIRQLYAKEPS